MENSEEVKLEELPEEIDPNEEGIPYDPNVEEDTEVVELDTEETETLEIDDRMPDELKQQLMKFNQKVQNVNSIINGTNQELNQYESQVGSLEEDDTNIEETESLEESVGNEIVEEDDGQEIGDLF